MDPNVSGKRRIAAAVIALVSFPAIAFALIRTYTAAPAASAVDPREVVSVEGDGTDDVTLPDDLLALLGEIEVGDSPYLTRAPAPTIPLRPHDLAMRWPVGDRTRITSPFGSRGGGFHHGTDIGCARGTQIRVAAEGTVVWSGSARVYGTMVAVHHGNGIVTMYAHLSSISVQLGQPVFDGTVLGFCGSTGRSTGPHLHFELRWDGRAWDPVAFLP